MMILWHCAPLYDKPQIGGMKTKQLITSCVSLLFVTGLFSLFSRMMCFSKLFGTSFTMCHLTGKQPVHLSCCQCSTILSKSTRPTISARPTNWPLAFTFKKRIYYQHKAISMVNDFKLSINNNHNEQTQNLQRIEGKQEFRLISL